MLIQKCLNSFRKQAIDHLGCIMPTYVHKKQTSSETCIPKGKYCSQKTQLSMR